MNLDREAKYFRTMHRIYYLRKSLIDSPQVCSFANNFWRKIGVKTARKARRISISQPCSIHSWPYRLTFFFIRRLSPTYFTREPIFESNFGAGRMNKFV